ncbi:Response regulator receiver protein CpdR [Pseudomonas fluorescens]|uniref:response regulator n=1 Tax=Pseudomonas fluorescens TaxID=294 RepID=UPI00125BAEE8|nr:response regulator [Pseudomonas fluorescens]CAG8865731.1 Response regulator receiver protein CpdR [Pseudomonas fluorescens]VVP87872.1 Response regulator receiver protein CpdR [Pseudomonas fluorescens]
MNDLIQAQHSPAILLVEDEPAIRELLVFALEDMGAIVEAVATADEGLTRLQEHPWALLLTDVQTPGRLDGLQLAWAAHEQTPHMRIVVMSGYHERMAAALPEHAVFLPKPWSLDAFYTTINAQLGCYASLQPAA